jgi:hypothetical protein
MFSTTNEVFRADAKDQIMCITKDLRGFPKNESLRICELLKTNETIGYGYITVPTAMGDELILNAIRYKDTKDIYLKHLTSWFEVDFAWYDKDSKQVMVWGDIEKVKVSIIDLKRLLETALLKDLQRMIDEDKKSILKIEIMKREYSDREYWDRERDYDPFKHT